MFPLPSATSILVSVVPSARDASLRTEPVICPITLKLPVIPTLLVRVINPPIDAVQ